MSSIRDQRLFDRVTELIFLFFQRGGSFEWSLLPRVSVDRLMSLLKLVCFMPTIVFLDISLSLSQLMNYVVVI